MTFIMEEMGLILSFQRLTACNTMRGVKKTQINPLVDKPGVL